MKKTRFKNKILRRHLPETVVSRPIYKNNNLSNHALSNNNLSNNNLSNNNLSNNNLSNNNYSDEMVINKIKSRSEYHKRVISVAIMILFFIFFSLFFIGPKESGRVITHVNILKSIPHSCGVILNPGYNIISLNCLSTYNSRSIVLNNTDLSLIRAIYSYNPASQDKWQVYNPNLPWYVVDDLSHMSRKDGYIVLVDQNSSGTLIFYNGSIVSKTTIDLIKGYNLVGYPSLINDTLPDALTNVTAFVNYMKTYRNDSWIEYNIGASNNTLTELRPGEGYWLNISQSNEWMVSKNRT